jgi:hypothetical protein
MTVINKWNLRHKIRVKFKKRLNSCRGLIYSFNRLPNQIFNNFLNIRKWIQVGGLLLGFLVGRPAKCLSCTEPWWLRGLIGAMFTQASLASGRSVVRTQASPYIGRINSFLYGGTSARIVCIRAHSGFELGISRKGASRRKSNGLNGGG